MLSDPIGLFDASPVADGAAAVVLSNRRYAEQRKGKAVDLVGSACATDTLSLQERNDPLWLSAVEHSANAALERAGIRHEDVDLFELHDAFTIIAALSLESSGFTPRGTAPQFAREKRVATPSVQVERTKSWKQPYSYAQKLDQIRFPIRRLL